MTSTLTERFGRHRPSGGDTGGGSAQRAAQSPWVARGARLGHVAKGVSYGMIAILALQVAVGQGGKTTDRQGVLREVAGKSYGTAALIALAVGFIGYALWRFARGFLDRDARGTDPEALAKRAKDLVIGAIYVGSAVVAISLVIGAGSSGGDEKEETAKVLDWPFGQWIVGALGLAMLAFGLYNGYRALTKKFRKDLREQEMEHGVQPWAIATGVVGHAARAVVFALVGIFLIKAAVEYDPDEAIGIDGALRKLAEQTYGTVLLGVVAAGLLAYAVFCFVQARYRRV
ncbi:MAG TPA: DUF1206 domain-containing protein [Acidimicrobiales bacterium]